MLTEKKIEKNYEKLVSINLEHKFLSEDFFTKYGEIIKTGPSLYSNYFYEGGALQYAFTVTKFAVMINGLLPKNKRFLDREIIKMSIMSNLQIAAPEEDGTYKEELNSENLYRFVSTGCELNESEFAYMYGDTLTGTFALGRLIKQAHSLALLEVDLPVKSEDE